MSNEEQNIDHELIARYLADECSGDEMRRFEQDLASDPVLKAEFDAINSIWNDSNVDNAPKVDTDAAWDKMTDRLDLKKKSGMSSSRMIWLAAAGFALLIGITNLLDLFMVPDDGPLAMKARTTKSDSGILQDTLSDGTIVTLNQHSTIAFNHPFELGSRKVTLTGEAYFDVASNPDKPFIIDAGGSQIEVIGTAFLVRSTAEDSVIVAVEEGTVKVSSQSEPTQSLTVTKDEHAIWHKKDQSVSKPKLQDASLLFWKDKKLVFRNMKLKNVAKVLFRTYGVEVIFADETIASEVLSGTFKDEPVETVVEVINQTFGLEAVWDDQRVTFSR